MPPSEQENENYFDSDDYFTGSRSNYDRLPGGYMFLRRGMFWKGKINRIKKYKQAGRVLDIGCAYGFLLYYMQDRFEVHGCDISPHAVRTCRKIFKDGERKKFFVHDVTRPLPFPNGYFDVIICQDVLEHVPDMGIPLHHIHDALNEEGIFFFRVPIKTKYKATEILRFEKDPTHVSVLPEPHLISMVEKVGFEVLEKRYAWMGAIPVPRLIHFGSDLNLILKKQR